MARDLEFGPGGPPQLSHLIPPHTRRGRPGGRRKLPAGTARVLPQHPPKDQGWARSATKLRPIEPSPVMLS